MSNEKTPLLIVEHLCQYFKMGKHYLKAVDDVNFEIYRGEVFGLVGESGCGKTTTGRSIIRLYDITGGSVYFDGKRIAAGTDFYKQEVKEARKKANAQIKALEKEYGLSASGKNEGGDPANSAEFQEKVKKIRDDLDVLIKKNTEEIKKAKFDHKNCNKEFAKFRMEQEKERYEPLIASASSEEEKA